MIAELQAQSIIVDLAHMSVAGIEAALPLLRRPFVLSHTGLVEAALLRRNIPASLAGQVAAAGGLVGIMLSTRLLGASTLAGAVMMVRRAIDAAGAEHVALGSDMDGALRMLIDVEGLPALADAYLGSGLSAIEVSAVMGTNAAQLLTRGLPVDSA